MTLRRTRSTKAEVQQLETQIFDLLEAEHPQSLRHVFYRNELLNDSGAAGSEVGAGIQVR